MNIPRFSRLVKLCPKPPKVDLSINVGQSLSIFMQTWFMKVQNPEQTLSWSRMSDKVKKKPWVWRPFRLSKGLPHNRLTFWKWISTGETLGALVNHEQIKKSNFPAFHTSKLVQPNRHFSYTKRASICSFDWQISCCHQVLQMKNGKTGNLVFQRCLINLPRFLQLYLKRLNQCYDYYWIELNHLTDIKFGKLL